VVSSQLHPKNPQEHTDGQVLGSHAEIAKMAPQTRSRKRKIITGPGTEVPDEPTFTLFPKLPIDLRIKIWRNASSVTRNVDLWIETYSLDDFNDSLDDIYYWCSSCAVPAVLHANQESRTEGLKHYTLDFGTKQIVRRREFGLTRTTMSISARI
jgi:2EXR family